MCSSNIQLGTLIGTSCNSVSYQLLSGVHQHQLEYKIIFKFAASNSKYHNGYSLLNHLNSTFISFSKFHFTKKPNLLTVNKKVAQYSSLHYHFSSEYHAMLRLHLQAKHAQMHQLHLSPTFKSTHFARYQPAIPRVRYSAGPLARYQPAIPRVRYSAGPLFRSFTVQRCMR
jgi:hypothetical protein